MQLKVIVLAGLTAVLSMGFTAFAARLRREAGNEASNSNLSK